MPHAIRSAFVGNRFAPRKSRSRAPSLRKNPAQIWWAPRPWLGRLGIYRCVCLVNNQLFVGVATPEWFTWVEAEQALTSAEAAVWAGRQA